VVLSFAAGFVDIVGALSVYDLFTAHVTGTTVRFGQRLIERDWHAALAAFSIVCAFFMASLLGRILIEIGCRQEFKRISSMIFAIELALLAGVAGIGSHRLPGANLRSISLTCGLLAMLAAAMGLQTASLTRIGALTVHTTFVTGMMNKLAQVVSRWVFGIVDLIFQEESGKVELRREISRDARQARFLLSIWTSYLAGAAGGTWVGKTQQLHSLYVPCGILLAVIVVDQVQPLSIEEEKEQVE
jgi:uncharacterized membrane protein YoaK (UPF0700 family)